MRLSSALATTVAIVVLAALTGCGGSHLLGVREIERAFWRAGVPFQTEQDRTASNPYLQPNPKSPLLELPGRARPLTSHVIALLIAVNDRTYRNRFAYVFDSVTNANAAVQREPLSKWMGSNVVRAKVANVVIFANVNGAAARRVRTAIAALSG